MLLLHGQMVALQLPAAGFDTSKYVQFSLERPPHPIDTEIKKTNISLEG